MAKPIGDVTPQEWYNSGAEHGREQAAAEFRRQVENLAAEYGGLVPSLIADLHVACSAAEVSGDEGVTATEALARAEAAEAALESLRTSIDMCASLLSVYGQKEN